MWVQVSTWIVQDEYQELGVGDPWSTVPYVGTDEAEEVDPSTPLSLNLASDPLSVVGPVYDIVGRHMDDESVGHIADLSAFSTTLLVYLIADHVDEGHIPIRCPLDPLVLDRHVHGLRHPGGRGQLYGDPGERPLAVDGLIIRGHAPWAG